MITENEVLFKFSTISGSQGDSLSSTGAGSLGKYMSSGILTSGTLHQVFDVVSGAEAVAGDTEYRCIFVHNSNGSLTLQDTVVWVESEVADGGALAIGVSVTGITNHNSATAQAEQIADESSAPAGISFTTPTSYATGLSIGNIGSNQCCAIWLRRTVGAGASAVSADGGVVKVSGGTLP